MGKTLWVTFQQVIVALGLVLLGLVAGFELRGETDRRLDELGFRPPEKAICDWYTELERSCDGQSLTCTCGVLHRDRIGGDL